MSNYKWKQILEMYPNQQYVVDLYNSKQMKELSEMWDCSVDCVRTIRDKLRLSKKNISQIELMQQYTKDQLEYLYFNKYNRHLKDMAEGLNVYQDTLSRLFEKLSIVQQPHHMSEYEQVRKSIGEKNKVHALERKAIEQIHKDLNWRVKADKARILAGTARQPHKKNRKIGNIPFDSLRESILEIGVIKTAKKFDIAPWPLRAWSKKHNISLRTGPSVATIKTEEWKTMLKQNGLLATDVVPQMNTDIELLVLEELKNRNFIFEQQKKLLGMTKPDFFIEPNIAIYCDGEYWHNKIDSMNRDRYVNRGLTEANYKVFRFLGSEIKKDVSACVDRIEAYINEQKVK